MADNKTIVYFRLAIRNRADDDDLIVLSSKPGDENTLLCAAPEGDGQSLDPIKGTVEVGTYTWQVIDKFEDGDTFTITSIIADENARNQWLSNKCIATYSTDLDATWRAYHTGFLNDMKLSTAKRFTFIVGDTDRKERKARLFKTITDTIYQVSNILGGPVESVDGVAWSGTPVRSWGPLIDYGPCRFIVIANPSDLTNPTTRVTLSLVSGNLPPLYLGQQGSFSIKLPGGLKWSIPAEYIDKVARPYFEWDTTGRYSTGSGQQSQPWGSFPQLEAKLRRTSDSVVFKTFPIAQATRKGSSYITFPGGDDFAVGDYSALVANSNDWLIVDWDTATMGSQPSVGTTFDVWVRPKVVSKDNPLHLRGHPVDLHRLVNTDVGIPDDSTSADATKAALGDLFYELWITDEWEYAKFTEMLKGSAGYAIRYNENGVQEFFPTRATQPASVDTVTTANALGDERGRPREIIFRVAEGSAIKGVDFKLKQFRLWSEKTDSESERPIDGIIADSLTINGKRRDDAVQSDSIIVYDVPGMIMLAGGAVIMNQPLALRQWIINAGNVIIDRAGWGWIEGEIKVLGSVLGKLGEYLDIELPHQVNAKIGQDPITQRGGSRRVQICGETKLPMRRRIKVKDAGNLAQDPPEADQGGTPIDPGLPVPELTLAPSDASPFTIATVTETNITELQDLNADTELQYLVQEATPDPTDEGAFFGPLLSSTGLDTIDAPAIASGQTIWVRGRAVIQSLGQRGAWSDWISITLGPGPTLPLYTLALSIDPSGILSAVANSVDAAITKVYFLAGVAGGSAPLYDDVVATTPDTTPSPFSSDALATMAEGETRTVGSVGEDALGNRTLLVTASITRAANTGSAEGAPGDLLLHFVVQSGDDDPLVLGPHGSGLEHIPAGWFRVNLQNGGQARGQATIAAKGSITSYLDVKYSLDNGVTWPDGQVLNIQLPLGIVNPTPGVTLEHQVSLAINLPADTLGDVLLRAAVGGGDGVTVPEIMNFVLKITASPQPAEDGESGIPAPADPTLPTGGDWGTVILDLDAQEGITALDLARVTAWDDQSTSGNDGYTIGGVGGGEYHVSGWNGGAHPFVRAKASDYAWVSPSAYSSNETFYILVDNVTGGGNGNDGGNEAANLMTNFVYPNNNGMLRVNGDGKVYFIGGINAFTSGQGTSTTAINDGAPHIIRVVHSLGAGNVKVYIDGNLEINVTSPGLTNGWTAANIYFGDPSTDPNHLTADYQRIVRYSSAGTSLTHGATGINLAETAILAKAA